MMADLHKHVQTTPFITFLKTLLMVFNFLFWIAGVAILALGIWAHTKLYVYMQLAEHYYTNTPWVLVGIGCGIILIGFLACCCTKKGHAALLYLFAIFLFIIFIAMVAVGIAGLVYRTKIEDEFKQGLQTGMEKYGKSDDKTSAMDGIQHNLKCCGKDLYSDWFAFLPNNSVPLSCCKNKDKCVNTHLNLNHTIPDTIHGDGCFRIVSAFVKSNFAVIGGVCLGFAFLQLFGSMLSCCLAKNINKNKYEQVA